MVDRRASPACAFASPIRVERLRSCVSRNGCWSSGPRTRTSRPSTGSRPCPPTSPSANSSTSPSCAGGSSATIRNSSRNSVSATSKGAVGGASIITPPCASPPTASWSPSGRQFPPQHLVAPRRSGRLPYPKVIDPEDPPLRPERHIPNSIATVRVRLINALIKTLPRCPCCGSIRRNIQTTKIMTQYDKAHCACPPFSISVCLMVGTLRFAHPTQHQTCRTTPGLPGSHSSASRSHFAELAAAS